jgi:periodic tryptophan protein 1
MSTISALCWVPRGCARPVLDSYEPSEEELARLQQQARAIAEESGESLKAAVSLASSTAKHIQQHHVDDDDVLAKYGFDTYDEEADGLMGVLGGAVHDDGDDGDAKSESDDEDAALAPGDALILTACHEDDVSTIEVNVYDTEAQALYVRHDILVGSMPLSLSWGQAVDASGTCNIVAAGYMDPLIEVWNIDVRDEMSPLVTLGGLDPNSKVSKKTKKKGGISASQFLPGAHTDAVLCVDLHQTHRTLLASASADTTIKIWDLSTASCMSTFSHHSDKACASLWHPLEHNLLLSASFDGIAAVVDCRTPHGAAVSFSKSASPIGSCSWCYTAPTVFSCASEDGRVSCYDVRAGACSKPFLAFEAHQKDIPAISFSPGVPGMLATASLDKHVRIWDLSNAVDSRPACVAEKALKVYCMHYIFVVSVFVYVCTCAQFKYLRIQYATHTGFEGWKIVLFRFSQGSSVHPGGSGCQRDYCSVGHHRGRECVDYLRISRFSRSCRTCGK